MAKEMLVTTTEKIPGHNYEVLGEVFGVTTQSKNVFSNIGAGLKNVVGGEIKAYTKMLHESREVAIARLREDADESGLRFSSPQNNCQTARGCRGQRC